MKPESLFQGIAKFEASQKSKPEKAQDKLEKINQNKDQVITLDIEGRNRGMRESKGVFPALREKIASIKARWSKKREMPRVVDTPAQRYEALMQKTQEKAIGAVAKIEGDISAIEGQGETLAAQKQAVAELSDALNEFASEKPVKQKENMSKAAELIRRASPNVKGGFGPIVQALESGNVPQDLRASVMDVIDQVSSSHKWGEKDAKAFKDVKAALNAQAYDNQTSEKLGMGEALESYAENLTENSNRKTAYADLGKKIKEVNPLKSGNGALAEAFINGEDLSHEQLLQGNNAIKLILEAARWPVEDKQKLNSAKDFIQSQLKNMDKVVEMPKRSVGPAGVEKSSLEKAA